MTTPAISPELNRSYIDIEGTQDKIATYIKSQKPATYKKYASTIKELANNALKKPQTNQARLGNSGASPAFNLLTSPAGTIIHIYLSMLKDQVMLTALSSVVTVAEWIVLIPDPDMEESPDMNKSARESVKTLANFLKGPEFTRTTRLLTTQNIAYLLSLQPENQRESQGTDKKISNLGPSLLKLYDHLTMIGILSSHKDLNSLDSMPAGQILSLFTRGETECHTLRCSTFSQAVRADQIFNDIITNGLVNGENPHFDRIVVNQTELPRTYRLSLTPPSINLLDPIMQTIEVDFERFCSFDFIRGIIAGNLDPEQFKLFAKIDYLVLAGYKDFLWNIARKSVTLDEDVHELTQKAISIGESSHKTIRQYFATNESDDYCKENAPYSYQEIVNEYFATNESDDTLLNRLIRVLTCYQFYYSIGERFSHQQAADDTKQGAQCKVTENQGVHLYKNWLENNTKEETLETIRFLKEMIKKRLEKIDQDCKQVEQNITAATKAAVKKEEEFIRKCVALWKVEQFSGEELVFDPLEKFPLNKKGIKHLIKKKFKVEVSSHDIYIYKQQHTPQIIHQIEEVGNYRIEVEIEGVKGEFVLLDQHETQRKRASTLPIAMPIPRRENAAAEVLRYANSL